MNQTHVPWISPWSQLTPAYKRHNKGPSWKASWARQGVSSTRKACIRQTGCCTTTIPLIAPIPFVCFFMCDCFSFQQEVQSISQALESEAGHLPSFRQWGIREYDVDCDLWRRSVQQGLLQYWAPHSLSLQPMPTQLLDIRLGFPWQAAWQTLTPGETSRRTTMLSPAPTADPHNRELNDY